MLDNYLAWAAARLRRQPAGSNSDIRLPFNVDPLVKTYLYTAYPLGMLTAGKHGAALYFNYIQLFFPRGKLEGAYNHKVEFFPPLGIRQYVELGHLKADGWNWRGLLGKDRDKIVQRLIAALERGKYVAVYVNEFFIPGTRFYLRSNCRHEHLLFGYDAGQRRFLGTCYLASGDYGITTTPVALFAEAMISERDRVPGRYSNNDVVEEISPSGVAALRFDPEMVQRQILAYAHSEDDGRAYAARLAVANGAYRGVINTWPSLAYQGAFGMEVYKYFKHWLHECISGRSEIDLRATRVLYEHKLVMKKCLHALCRMGACGDLSTGERAYDEIVALGRRVHLLAFSITTPGGGPTEKNIPKLFPALEALETKEREILHGPVARAFSS